ncbi:MAG: PTS IIA-like nitrogen regulatory protein PtsN [Gammaproteobacteria bacterium]|nr:PTS IIA-like nitrogen regulatory protein PtsN [Pseudomonadales bacterium]MCP5330771.1 PTS IIA-like nitrogen regulatory protein PtsN [Pseudomonadales bacterium]
MQLNTILTPERCFCKLPGVSKKRFLTTISELISTQTQTLSADHIYSALLAREQLGSTGIGNGIAIPHCRVADCEHITGALVTLEEGIDFDAIDSRSVDLLFVLIVPAQETEEHLKVLGALASLFHQDSFCEALRQAGSADALYEIATQS